MTEIILHHYPQSPVSEKVRVGLGIKDLSWRSVEIPRLPPRPDLIPLTGGYRRTPVMQIGADIYCDSHCILRELERRFPEPSFAADGGAGLAWGIACWTDSTLFNLTVKLVLGAAGDSLPADFTKDRGRLYFGADWGRDLKDAQADQSGIVAQIRTQFGWLDRQLTDGRRFMQGEAAGLPDASAYYLVWFLRGRWDGGAAFLSEFPTLEAWEQRVRAIGHGKPKSMSSGEASEVARLSEPETPERGDPKDPQGLAPGMAVAVAPDGDGGDPDVAGTIRYLDRDTIGLSRRSDIAGSISILFPRLGYRVTRL